MIKEILIVLASVLITSSTAYGLHSWQANKDKAAFEKTLSAANDKCKEDKLKSEKVSREYQKTISSLSGQLDAAHRLFDLSAIRIIGQDASGRYGSPGEQQPAGPGACSGPSISGKDFVNLLGEGEHYRLQLLGCQNGANAIQGPEIAK